MSNSEKKTIIYIGGFELPDKNAAAHRVLSNAKALREIGYRIVLLDIDRETTKRVLETKNICEDFERYSIPHDSKRLFSIKSFQEVFRLYGDTVAAVVAYNYPSIALEKIRRFCRERNVKVLADCTEWYSYAGEKPVKRLAGEMDSWLRMKVIQPRLDGMIAISRYLTAYYQEKLPTVCVPPLVDMEESKWCKIDEESHDEVRIAYAGSPGKYKDKLNLIIEALSQVDGVPFRFEVIGIDKGQYLSYYPEHNDLIANMGERVVFRGRVTHQQALDHIKQADFSMFVREKNRVTMAGFPTKFAESISCGTPVITNRTSNLDEYLVEGENGFWLTQDLKASLISILAVKADRRHQMKAKMDRTLFDFHNYSERFRPLFAEKGAKRSWAK